MGRGSWRTWVWLCGLDIYADVTDITTRGIMGKVEETQWLAAKRMTQWCLKLTVRWGDCCLEWIWKFLQRCLPWVRLGKWIGSGDAGNPVGWNRTSWMTTVQIVDGLDSVRTLREGIILKHSDNLFFKARLKKNRPSYRQFISLINLMDLRLSKQYFYLISKLIN